MSEVEGGGAGGANPAGWYGDPHGRFEQRYFDGTQWTEHVARNGVQSVDPVPAAGAVGGPLSSVRGPGPGGIGGPGGYTGASLTPGYWSPTPQNPAVRRPRQEQNRIGAGLFVCIAGWLVIAVATVLPWFGERNLFELPTVTSRVVSSTGYTTSTDYSFLLTAQVLGILLWLILAIIGTTLPYQPNKLMGFLLATCLGLIVCWRRLGPHDRSMRANILCIILTLGSILRVWIAVDNVDNRIESVLLDLGSGPYVVTAGLVIVAVGMLLGRRRELVEI